MRNRLIHAYFDIDLDVLWETVTGDLPSLLPVLDDALGDLDKVLIAAAKSPILPM